MIKILDTSDVEWDYYISKLPLNLRDIYFTRQYYKVQEVNGEGTGRLFIYEYEDKIALYPFLINEIENYNLNQSYYDIETAYGYGGPIVSCNDNEFISKFENAFIEYCKDNNIVAEFIRFNPMLKNNEIFKNNIKLILNRTTISLNLNKQIEEIWSNDISSKNRNMIRKAEKSGLKVEFEKDLQSFKMLYEKTMNKVQASDYYYFNEDYYMALDKMDNTYISIKLDDIIIASAIFLKCGDYFHYHLAGSLREYLKFSPNNLLLWSAIKYANENGFKKMHFGGGLTNSLDDNLFKFKKSFSKDTEEFYIGTRVHNEEVYKFLIEEWERKNEKEAKLFLQYKL